MNFLLIPGAGFDGERVLKGLDFAALLYRIGGSGRLRGLRYLLRLRLVRHLRRLRHLHRLRRLRCSRCFRCLRRSRHLHRLRRLRRLRCFRCLRRSHHPGKNRRLKTEATVPDDGTVACSDSYFFGVTVPRMLKTILSGVPLVDTVIDLAMPPIRLVS